VPSASKGIHTGDSGERDDVEDDSGESSEFVDKEIILTSDEVRGNFYCVNVCQMLTSPLSHFHAVDIAIQPQE
jgi:hypothetical protein